MKALEELHQEAIAKEDFKKWICGKQEVEIVDMILCIKNKLQLPVNSNSTLPPCESGSYIFKHFFLNQTKCLFLFIANIIEMKKEIREMLLKKLNDLLSSLPDDLKTILI